MNYKIIAALLIGATLSISSCKKDDDHNHDDDNTAGTTGTLRINVTPMFGDSMIDLNTESYVTANNDTLTISRFKFYLSNIKLTTDNNTTYSVPDGYYLIDAASTSSWAINLTNVPSGHYTSATFLIGVDSARNVSGSQTGALDPANGMFWTWSTGYIMAKLEGNSPQSTAAQNNVTYHIGGFTGVNSALRTASVNFGSTHAIVSSTANPQVNIVADASEFFKTPNTLSIATTSFQMSVNATSKAIADNYSDMLKFVSVQN